MLYGTGVCMTAAQADAELAKVDQQVYEAQLADQGNSVV